jgi:hypothetical protein
MLDLRSLARALGGEVSAGQVLAPGLDPIGANILGACTGRRALVAARADVGRARPIGVAGKPGWARA